VKLPAFYLLDAISKNVHEPYARRFAPVVSRLFLDTYGQVDDATRQKMEEMLITWRTGSPNRTELFGAVNQIAIERGVWGDRGDLSVSRPAEPRRKRYSKTFKITKAQVLSELQFAIDLKRRALQANPADLDAQHKIEVMQQVRVHRSFIIDMCSHFSLAAETMCSRSWRDTGRTAPDHEATP